MKDALSVITDATRGFVTKLAQRREISERRMHEQLGDQCCYPKTKLLIRDIAAVNQHGARLIKADIDALFADVLEQTEVEDISLTRLHKEAFEAIDALLADKPPAECMRELRELIAVAQQKLEGMERIANAGPLRVA